MRLMPAYAPADDGREKGEEDKDIRGEEEAETGGRVRWVGGGDFWGGGAGEAEDEDGRGPWRM